MKTLLTSLQSHIVDGMDYLGGIKAVHLLPDENLLPETTSFPCIGLKDGGIDHKEFTNAARQFMSVELFAFVSISSADEAIVGKGDDKGILDVMSDLKTAALFYEPSGYVAQHNAFSEGPSQTMNFGGTALIQKKKMTLKWVKV